MKLLALILPIILLASGCTSNEPVKTDLTAHEFSSSAPPDASPMETLKIAYPKWDEKESSDPLTVVAMQRPDGICSFHLNAIEAPLDWYRNALIKYVEDSGGEILDEGELIDYRMETEDGNYTFYSQTKGVFCADKSYYVIYSCLEDKYDINTGEEIFDSMYCVRDWEVRQSENRKLGLTVNPGGEKTNLSLYYNAYNIARNSGVQHVHSYVQWGDVEERKGYFNWTVSDFLFSLIRGKGFTTSVSFSDIHSSVKGEFPSDFTFRGWDDPVMIERFSDFVITFLDRHGDVITHVEIGNEVDIYMHMHPDELNDYAVFYQGVYDRVKKAYPDVKVGIIFAYHDMMHNGEVRVYEKLAHIGDFDAFTLYIYNRPGFIFDRDPSEFLEHMEEIEELTGNRTFAMEEIGWNTDPGLKGKESDQVKHVGYFFDYLESAPERVDYMNYFMLHDGAKDNCIEQGKSFLEDDSPYLENEEFMDTFSDFLCYLGMINNDGTPKAAWEEWTKRTGN